ncbi:hypothetical protein B0T10DRAFT_294595 [Thelonectria olida]|uniref:MYND-type domain-containing protein n=1 Tax=Thelonectria olida TaxID=1576542 RepID=A0A9P9ARQ2_9HYPO|nr:hypothetical protein B0T10DRAFT_294595 [Thelonectria olida]
MALSCTICKKPDTEVSIKRCAKCSDTPYCSRECQKKDWKAHKKICGKSAGAQSDTPHDRSLSPPKGLDGGISQPFTRLDNNTWLHGRSESDVFRLLLEAYRLRTEDDYNMEGNADADGLYGGNPDGLPGFRRFLNAAERRPGLLPDWWNAEKRKACEGLGLDEKCWQNLKCAIEKSDVIEHYGDPQFPMQLRMFAETALQRGPGGQNGTSMRKLMVSMEQGTAAGDSPFTNVMHMNGNFANRV